MKLLAAGFIFLFSCQLSQAQCTSFSGGRSHTYNVGQEAVIDGVRKRCQCLDKIKPGEKCLSASWVTISQPKPPTTPIRPSTPSVTPPGPGGASSPRQNSNPVIVSPLNFKLSLVAIGGFRDGDIKDNVSVAMDKFGMKNVANKTVTVKSFLTYTYNSEAFQIAKERTYTCKLQECIIPDTRFTYDKTTLKIGTCAFVAMKVVIRIYVDGIETNATSTKEINYRGLPCDDTLDRFGS